MPRQDTNREKYRAVSNCWRKRLKFALVQIVRLDQGRKRSLRDVVVSAMHRAIIAVARIHVEAHPSVYAVRVAGITTWSSNEHPGRETALPEKCPDIARGHNHLSGNPTSQALVGNWPLRSAVVARYAVV